MPLPEYFTLLAGHDWHYDQQESRKYWSQRQAARRELELLAEQSTEHRRLYWERMQHELFGGVKPESPIQSYGKFSRIQGNKQKKNS